MTAEQLIVWFGPRVGAALFHLHTHGTEESKQAAAAYLRGEPVGANAQNGRLSGVQNDGHVVTTSGTTPRWPPKNVES